MIGTFQYVVHKRLGIVQVVGLGTIFFSNPKKSHMVAIKRIFKYLKGIEEYGLWHPCKDNFELSVFIDVD